MSRYDSPAEAVYGPDVTEQRVMLNWDPEVHPVHCSNCVNTRVYTHGARLFVRCAQGHLYSGKQQGAPYAALMRLSRPVSLRVARDCPDWESMDA